MFRRPKIVGVLNITPDSFSDGGKYLSKDNAVQHVIRMIEEGVDVIDIGAESTRNEIKPNEKKHQEILQKEPIKLAGEQLEWQRLEPILPTIIPIIKKAGVKVSIDTRNADTIRKVLEYGVDWVNDVTGADNDEIIGLIADADVEYVVMHNLGVPANPKVTVDSNLNIIEVVYEWFAKKVIYLESKGIKRDRIIFDPGISFGKTAEQGILLMQSIEKFKRFGCKILVGHSRKSIFNLFTDVPRESRDIETYAASIYLGTKHIDYIRVHDVSGNLRALKVAEGIF